MGHMDIIDKTLDRLSKRHLCTCEPVSIALGVMAVGGAATSIIGQNTARQAAKGQENQKRIAQEDLMKENKRRATYDYLLQSRQENLKQAQEQMALGVKVQDVNNKTGETIGTARSSAAERGIAGSTLEQIIEDYHFQQDAQTGQLRANQGMADVQHAESVRSYGEGYSRDVADVRPYQMKVQPPVDYFGPIFGAGQSIAGTPGIKKLAAK